MAKPHGQFVQVKGRTMHLRQMGSGKKTINISYHRDYLELVSKEIDAFLGCAE